MFMFLLYCTIGITLLDFSKNKSVQNVKYLIVILVYFSLLVTGYTIGIIPALITWSLFAAYSVIISKYLSHLKINVYKLEGETQVKLLPAFLQCLIVWPFIQEIIPSILKLKFLEYKGVIPATEPEVLEDPEKFSLDLEQELGTMEDEVLHAGVPFNLSFEAGLKTQSQSITWSETNAVTAEYMQILKGSFLLLNAGVAATDTAVITVEGVSYNTFVGNPAQHRFNTEGLHTVTAVVTTDNGLEHYSFNVEVFSVPEVEAPYVWRGKERSWSWPELSEVFTVQASGMKLVQNEDDYTLERKEILEEVNLVARLGENGPIATALPTKAFRVHDVVEGYVKQVEAFEDGSAHIQDTMFGINLPAGLELKLSCFSGIVFEDGSGVKTLTKGSFSNIDEYELNFYRDATRQGAICHRYLVYQDGVLVGEGHK